MQLSLSKKYLDELSYNVLGAAIEVHKFLGRGLLESIYHECLKEELLYRKINFLTEFKIPVVYREKEMNLDFRCDLFIENCIVVELKSVAQIIPQHQSQLLTYMKLLKAPKGILINFNSDNIFKNGQETFVNELFRSLPEE